MPKKLSRLARLSGLTSKVSSTYIAQRIKGSFQSQEENQQALRQLHLENAERITDAMGSLKGAAMKVGQSIAVLADSMDLPEDVSKIFGRLHNQAEPIPFEVIEKVLQREYNGEYKKIFSRIDPEPLGTASLAQAHAAWLQSGKAVVIKVLHEGVEHSVGTDLTALKTIMIAGRFLKRSREEIDIIFDEVKCRLQEELDYEQEAQNLKLFHNYFQGIEGVRIPLPIEELCTKRILVMDRLLGASLDVFLKTATPEAKQRAGNILTTVFHEMAYGFRSLHADPHGGNFLFSQDGSVGLIDFGCVKRLPLPFIVSYAKIANAIIDEQREEMLHIATEMGILNDASPEAQEALWEFASIIREPFQVERYTCGSQEDQLMEKVKEASLKIIGFPEIRTPRDIIFLHRALTGIYSMLCRLQHEGKYEEIRRKYAQEVIDVSEGKKEDRGWKK